VVWDLEQIGPANHPGIEEGCLALLLDIPREEETELLVIDGEDERIVIDRS
jgi:hypothetical protein